MVQIIEFTCTCPAQCRLCLCPVTVISLSQPGVMSIYHYFNARDGLTNPKGSLLQTISSAAIASANPEVQRVVEAKKEINEMWSTAATLAGARSPHPQKVGCCGGSLCEQLCFSVDR